MQSINPEILEFLETQRICVLAVEMLDGSPHGATLHFSNTEDPLVFYFKTSRKYRKSEPLLGRQSSRASIVVGFDENNMKTFQADGIVKLVETAEERKAYEEARFGKFPEKRGEAESEDAVAFLFTPTWWRFTDWTKPEGKTIWLSTDK